MAVAMESVEAIMTSGVISIGVNTTVRGAIELLVEKGISGAPIADEQGKPISVCSETDLLKLAATGNMEIPIRLLLERLVPADQIVMLKPGDQLKDAFKIFLTHRIRRILVTDGTKIVGLVTRTNLLKAFLKHGSAMR